MVEKLKNLGFEPTNQNKEARQITKDNQFKFGSFNIPFKGEFEDLEISIQKDGANLVYSRRHGEDKTESMILSNASELFVHPIEPVNTPKHLTPYLYIGFDKKLIVEPKTTRKIYLIFPQEIGVFIHGEKGTELIDAISFMSQKFTLYGEVRNGELCRYCQSKVYSKLPNTKTMREGVLELHINNPTGKWLEVSRVVLNAYGMKLYFNDRMVSIKAVMKLLSEVVAETEVVLESVVSGMAQAIELYTVLRTPVLQKKFVMECGL
jgi:hypothetical protein